MRRGSEPSEQVRVQAGSSRGWRQTFTGGWRLMIRTGAQYRDGLRDGREVWIDGERVGRHRPSGPEADRRHPRAHVRHAARSRARPGPDLRRETTRATRSSTACRRSSSDWHDKWKAVDTVLNDIKGVVTRVGDETVGEMWSLYDGRDVLNEIDPQFAANIARHIHGVIETDVFHVSANTDPKGDRSKPPQEQDPDMMVHVVKETDHGIVVRGAKFETASGYADQAFLKPTVGAWTNEKLSNYAVGCIVKMGAPGVTPHRALGLCGQGLRRGLSALQPLRRGRLPDGARQRPHPLGGRVLLPAHARGPVHPRHAAPLLGVPLHAARPLHGRHDDRCRPVERQADRPRQAAGRAREARRPRVLPRGHQCPPDGRDRPGAAEPRRAADAAPVDALCRPRASPARTFRI